MTAGDEPEYEGEGYDEDDDSGEAETSDIGIIDMT